MSSPATPEESEKFRFKLLPTLKRGEMWLYFGPAFVASVAYIDPGNFASNFEGGGRFGYTLLWVLLWSNGMAILIQYLSAKLGIATGKTLPQNCRAYFSPKVNFGLWIAAELAALATDLAEFLGAALGFYLLLGIPLLPAALITAVVVIRTGAPWPMESWCPRSTRRASTLR
jgi:manganese transport protein